MKVLVGTKQFKMVLDEDFVKRLRSVADKTGRDSAQHLAEEVLALYLPLYVAVHDATQRSIEHQTTMMLEEGRLRTALRSRTDPVRATDQLNGVPIAPTGSKIKLGKLTQERKLKTR